MLYGHQPNAKLRKKHICAKTLTCIYNNMVMYPMNAGLHYARCTLLVPSADVPANYGLVAAPVLLFLLVVYLEVTRRPPDMMELAPNMVAIDPL